MDCVFVFQCECGHVWRAKVYNDEDDCVRGDPDWCPKCGGRNFKEIDGWAV
jgi:hypothetical protein